MNIQIINWILLGLLVLVLQVLVMPLIEIGEVTPDLFVLFTVIVLMKFGKFSATSVAFFSALFVEMLSFDMLGIIPLARVSVVFWVGYYIDRQSFNFNIWNLTLIVLFISLLQEIVISFFSFQAFEIPLYDYIVRYSLLTSLYTTVIALIWFLLTENPKSLSKHARSAKRVVR